jgi:polar amino acid transport system permease protein
MSLDLNFAPAASDALLAGTLVTIEITLCALLLSCARLLIGVARINPQGKVLYGLASGYVAIICTPLLVQLFIWYYGLPRLGVMLPFFLRRDWTGPLPAAYVSEIVRGAIMSVERGQNEAARSLGMSSKQAI